MKESRTGIAQHASTVAFAFARSFTSHLRAWFQRRYKPRYRFAGLVFGFDLFLLAVAVALFAFDAALLFQAVLPRDAGIRLAFRAPIVRASDATPIDLNLRVADARWHEDVTLRVRFPEWVEVLRAEPALRKDGSVFFGNLGPSEERSMRLLVRVRAVRGREVPFAFSLTQKGIFGIPEIVTGEEKRIVGSSALAAVPATPSDAIVSGGSVPILITNDGSVPIPLATLRVVRKDGAPDARFSSGDAVFVNDLPARSSRLAYLDIGETSATSVLLGWELQDGAQAVNALDRAFDVASAGKIAIREPIRSIAGQDVATVRYENSDGVARLFVAHPLQMTHDAFHLYPLTSGSGRVSIPLDPSLSVSSTEWSVIPIFSAGSMSVLGRRVVGRFTATFPFHAEARYYSALGDQLGIGPLPPNVGEATSYWIVWTVGPTESAFNRLSLSTTLPEYVRATGKYASAGGGAFQTDGASVTWDVPRLDVTGGETVTFAFEVTFTPTRAMRGKTAPLVNESTATAIDVRTGDALEASAAGDDTNLSQDTKGKGKGIIR